MSRGQIVFSVFFGPLILLLLWGVIGGIVNIPEDVMVTGIGILGVAGLIAPLVLIVIIVLDEASSPMISDHSDHYDPPSPRIETEQDCADHGYLGFRISPYPGPPVVVFGVVKEATNSFGISARLRFFGSIESAKQAFPSAKVLGFGPDVDDLEPASTSPG